MPDPTLAPYIRAKKGRRSAEGPVHSQVHRRAEYRLCPVGKNAGRQEVYK